MLLYGDRYASKNVSEECDSSFLGSAAEEIDYLLCVLDRENEGIAILRNVKTA